MIQAVCYAFIYLFEVLACFMFYENFYQRKADKLFCFVTYTLAFLIQYGLSYAAIPYINLITFVVCNFLIALLCYESRVKTCVFTTLMLSFFMFITELIVIYSSTYIFEIYYLADWEANILALVLQSSLSKLLFFVIIFFWSKTFKIRAEHTATKFTVMLGILPLTSIVNYCIMFYWGVKTYNTSQFNGTLAICAILLLFANLFVFYIYEMVQRTYFENTQLQLEIQRGEISTEYYELLSKEYENSRILIHDIKNHFQHIAGLTIEGQPQEVIGYIDSISKDFGLKERIKYSGNDLVDVIINRYAAYCKDNGLIFEVEALCSKLEFMDRSDVSSLLDNLLTNAVEAAEKSENKRITISIYRQENSFVMTDHIFIKVLNSCDSRPKIKNGLLKTSKIDTLYHGFGTKSVRRVVSKYNGDYNWEYNDIDREFITTVILQTK